MKSQEFKNGSNRKGNDARTWNLKRGNQKGEFKRNSKEEFKKSTQIHKEGKECMADLLFKKSRRFRLRNQGAQIALPERLAVPVFEHQRGTLRTPVGAHMQSAKRISCRIMWPALKPARLEHLCS